MKEYPISILVLGYPLTLAGKISPRTKMVEYFADLVKKNYEIKVVFQDERLTTKQAQTFLLDLGISFKKRQKVIDKLAAQIILERFLNTKKG
ncbi:conserved hypothetical protein [Mesomycoplasma hyopneumoniae 7448]|nr:conserved hypothetical protein [Mesomycoplasma hyopneumoniae 7448]AGQ50832.1 hypothetical protein MHL_2692 [Mesomycoplasma hyopneumoniae 7422]